MKLKHILKELQTPDGVSTEDALEMEVEFAVSREDAVLELLSVYEDNGKIIIDIGIE